MGLGVCEVAAAAERVGIPGLRRRVFVGWLWVVV